MRALSTGKKYKQGMITLEILIAFTILILSISAVILVAFGNQSVAIDSQISEEAIEKAQAMLEKARADSRFDFNLINPSSTTETSELLTFTKILDVQTASTDPTLDLWTKRITSNISWQTAGKNLSTQFTTLLTNPSGSTSSDTCSSVLEGDWANPEVESTIDFSTIIPAGIYTLTDTDVYNDKLYVTAGRTTNATNPAFFVFDVSNTSNPVLLSAVDNNSASTLGMNAITVASNYAYITNASSPATVGQLQIFDVSNSTSPILVKSFPLPGNSSVGNSIFYQDNYVYLGTTGGVGNEFNVIEVTSPTSPVLRGGYSFDSHSANAIIARDDYAHVATPATEEITVLNITNSGTPYFVAGFNASSGSGNGKSMYLVGNKLYLGKTTGASLDFHILDVDDPFNTLPELGGKDVTSSINGLIVRDYLSFLITGTPSTGTKLQILRTDDAANITNWNTPLILSSTSNATEPSMDCEGNRMFISSNNSSGQGYIYIIKPGS